MKDLTPAGKTFLEMLEKGTEVMPIEKILANLSRGEENVTQNGDRVLL